MPLFSLINFTSKSFVGLDLSKEEIRLLALKSTSRGRMVTAIGITELPSGSIMEGRIKDPELLQKELSQLVQDTGVGSCSVAIALPKQFVMTREIQVSSGLSELECDREIAANLSYYLPGVTEEVSYDFERTGPQEDKVELVAARLDLINEYINIVNQSNLQVRIIDVDSRALLRGIAACYPAEVIAILEKGSQSAQISIYHKHHLHFSQRIFFASDFEFIQELKLAMQMLSFSHPQFALSEWILFGKNLSLDLIEHIKNECSITIVDINFLSHLIISQSVKYDTLSSMSQKMWISLGLALRGEDNEY